VGNLRIADPSHGLEKSGTIEAINDLLLQSDAGVIRVFPVWPSTKDAGFVKLRTKDAFVVSSALAAGRVGYVDITSDAGKPVSIQNPWPGKTVAVSSGGASVSYTTGGNVITFGTRAGATYTLTAP
jgi:alpha-L-fucosidase 2